jgi:hypothetical protein
MWTVTIVMAAVAGQAGLAAARLGPDALAGWQGYVAAVEHRRAGEAHDPRRFLAVDFEPGAAADRRAALAGRIVVDEVTARDARGAAIEVPSAMVHHWRGVVFLPDVSLDRLMATLESEAPPTGPDVRRATVLARAPGALRLYLRLQRTRIVTVVYDTEHDVRFQRDGSSRASSVSIATKIAEVADAGTPRERELPAGDDRGFLWRLRAYWRYEAVDGGVLAECESISLSRGIPFGLQYVAGPLIASAARESMERTLTALRAVAEAGS